MPKKPRHIHKATSGKQNVLLGTDIPALWIVPSLNKNSRLENGHFSSCNSWIHTRKGAGCCLSTLGSQRTLIPSREHISFRPRPVNTRDQATLLLFQSLLLLDPHKARSLVVTFCSFCTKTGNEHVLRGTNAFLSGAGEVQNLPGTSFSSRQGNFIHQHVP